MAFDYAALKETRYDYSTVTKFNKNSKRAVYKIKLKNSVKLLDLTNKEEREAFILWYCKNNCKKVTKKLIKTMCDDIKRDYSKFLHYHLGYEFDGCGNCVSTPHQGFTKLIKEYGYEGYISNELGYNGGKIGKGVSYYIFDLNLIEVLDKVEC